MSPTRGEAWPSPSRSDGATGTGDIAPADRGPAHPSSFLLVVVGAIMLILGAMGRAVGGRRHYYWTEITRQAGTIGPTRDNTPWTQHARKETDDGLGRQVEEQQGRGQGRCQGEPWQSEGRRADGTVSYT